MEMVADFAQMSILTLQTELESQLEDTTGVNATTPTKVGTPRYVFTPVRSVTPLKPATTHKSVTPLKPATPLKSVTPLKPATPLKPVNQPSASKSSFVRNCTPLKTNFGRKLESLSDDVIRFKLKTPEKKGPQQPSFENILTVSGFTASPPKSVDQNPATLQLGLTQENSTTETDLKNQNKSKKGVKRKLTKAAEEIKETVEEIPTKRQRKGRKTNLEKLTETISSQDKASPINQRKTRARTKRDLEFPDLLASSNKIEPLELASAKTKLQQTRKTRKKNNTLNLHISPEKQGLNNLKTPPMKANLLPETSSTRALPAKISPSQLTPVKKRIDSLPNILRRKTPVKTTADVPLYHEITPLFPEHQEKSVLQTPEKAPSFGIDSFLCTPVKEIEYVSESESRQNANDDEESLITPPSDNFCTNTRDSIFDYKSQTPKKSKFQLQEEEQALYTPLKTLREAVRLATPSPIKKCFTPPRKNVPKTPGKWNTTYMTPTQSRPPPKGYESLFTPSPCKRPQTSPVKWFTPPPNDIPTPLKGISQVLRMLSASQEKSFSDSVVSSEGVSKKLFMETSCDGSRATPTKSSPAIATSSTPPPSKSSPSKNSHTKSSPSKVLPTLVSPLNRSPSKGLSSKQDIFPNVPSPSKRQPGRAALVKVGNRNQDDVTNWESEHDINNFDNYRKSYQNLCQAEPIPESTILESDSSPTKVENPTSSFTATKSSTKVTKVKNQISAKPNSRQIKSLPRKSPDSTISPRKKQRPPRKNFTDLFKKLGSPIKSSTVPYSPRKSSQSPSKTVQPLSKSFSPAKHSKPCNNQINNDNSIGRANKCHTQESEVPDAIDINCELVPQINRRSTLSSPTLDETRPAGMSKSFSVPTALGLIPCRRNKFQNPFGLTATAPEVYLEQAPAKRKSKSKR